MHYVTTLAATSRFDRWTATQHNKLADSTLMTHQTETFVKIVTFQCIFSEIMFVISYFLGDSGYIIVNS